MKGRPSLPLRWVPTEADGRRWELWRGRKWLGRVLKLPGRGVDVACVERSDGAFRLRLLPARSMRAGGFRLLSYLRAVDVESVSDE